MWYVPAMHEMSSVDECLHAASYYAASSPLLVGGGLQLTSTVCAIIVRAVVYLKKVTWDFRVNFDFSIENVRICI